MSEQEEDDDDGEYDDDIEEGCEDDVVDNVSKNTTSTTYTCYSGGLGDSKLRAYSCATDDAATCTNSLRKRNIVKSASTKTTTKSKSVQFVTSTHSPKKYTSAELNVHSKPLKKIVFNGTFPIDDPYSSRF